MSRLVIAAELLGHARLETTRVYTRPTAEDRSKFDCVFAPVPPHDAAAYWQQDPIQTSAHDLGERCRSGVFAHVNLNRYRVVRATAALVVERTHKHRVGARAAL